jgi:cysteine synthase A
VLAKLEFYNPSASVKDRLGIASSTPPRRTGRSAGGTIVEGTSGNTGIALAMIGAARGYRCDHRDARDHVEGAPRAAPRLRRRARAHPAAEGMKGAVARAEQIAAETPGAVLAKQFENQANAEIHRLTTAEEVWNDTDGGVDIFGRGIGTGGTITGVGQVLKERKPEVQVVGVEPAESPILNGGQPGPHKIQGIGANFVPEILDREVYDEIIDVNIDQAVATARRLGIEEGILGGISSGATVYAATQLAKRPRTRQDHRGHRRQLRRAVPVHGPVRRSA